MNDASRRAKRKPAEIGGDYTINKLGRSDIPLTVVTLTLVAFGVLMVYSAGSYTGERLYGSRYYYVFKQLMGAGLGIAAMFLMSRIDYHVLYKLRYVILGISVVLLAIVFIPGVGIENYGARRWINTPFFTIQASEVSKFGFIVFAASYIGSHSDRVTTFKGILPVVCVGGSLCALIILEPNMSVTICMAALMIVMLFLGGAKIKHILAIVLPLIAAAVVLILVEPYRFARLMAFIDPWQSPLEEGYQLIQSYYGLGAGGLFGVGLFNSRQKYLFLPFAESDFIFSIIGEELGLFGCLVVMAGYIFMIRRALRVALQAPDRLGSLLCSGIAAIIAIQTCVNIAVVTGSIPPTGLPLPFISSGSSGIIVFMSGIGIVNSVSRRSSRSSVLMFEKAKRKKGKNEKHRKRLQFAR
ncbi:MAG: putative lipid II flippase FtsW [Clostridiales bacterium]|nr:putative lipid II flippase FtsW [Clostridiales bacterium]